MPRVVIHALRTVGLVLLAAIVVGPARSAAIAPTGEIAVVRIQKGQAEIVLRDLDGGERVVVARGRNPAWSPDGSSLAFERDGAVWIVSPVGSPERRVAAGHRPSWSPDGAALVVSDHGTLRIIRLQDGQTRALGAGESPNWSSRGVIAFTRNGDIYVIDSTGGALRRLTSGKAADSDPSWSSDGARLVFVRDGAVVARAPEPGAAALFLARSSVAATDPAWSPDGRYVVFSSGGQVCAAQRDPERARGLAGSLAQAAAHPDRGLTLAARLAAASRHRREPGARLRACASLLDSRLRRRPVFHLRLERDRSRQGAQANALVRGHTSADQPDTRALLEDIWLAGHRDGNRLVGLKTARGRCRRLPPLEWECALGSLGPGETATVEVRYRGRYWASAGVFFYRDMPSFPG